MNCTKTIITNSPAETIEMGCKIAEQLTEGDFIALIGELGTGKTIFVKGLAKGLGVEDPLYVNSPSFVLMKEYKGKKFLYHFDAYRLDFRSFCETLNYEQYFYGKGVTVVEWADKIKNLLPEDYLEVTISYSNGNERQFQFCAIGERYKNLISKIKTQQQNP